jgi:DNA topoisomerase-1
VWICPYPNGHLQATGVDAAGNGTFGLTTLGRRHVEIADGVVRLDYLAKSGRHRLQSVADDVSGYLRETLGERVSAKDFRTWHATVLMAVALAVGEAPANDAAARRMLSRAYAEVSHHLGNTPAVCRDPYVDPRIVDLWRHRRTVRGALDDLGAHARLRKPATQGAVEAAVLDLLE